MDLFMGYFCIWVLGITRIGSTLAIPSTVLNSTTTTDLPSILDGVKLHSNHHHKCYVCLPPDKSSPEAKDILKLFSNTKVQDCVDFDSKSDRKHFEKKCPEGYGGCLLRFHGNNVSRSCAQFKFNDCKTANNKELCFCSGHLCNVDRESIPKLSPPLVSSSSSESEEKGRTRLEEEQDEAESRRFFWQKGETDDEDLLEMADDTGLSGDGPYPPGVIDQYTTTPKPTLVPNLRGDPRFKTTPPPPPTSGAVIMNISYFIVACFSLIVFGIFQCSSR